MVPWVMSVRSVRSARLVLPLVLPATLGLVYGRMKRAVGKRSLSCAPTRHDVSVRRRLIVWLVTLPLAIAHKRDRKTPHRSWLQGEAYLSFRDGRVYRNNRSPATYLNDDRYGKVALPAQADPKAAPVWEEIGQRETYDWHDHRIHWMSPTLPPRVEAVKDEPQHVVDWTVPGTLDGQPLRISGSLDYEPPPSGNPRVLVIIGVFLLFAGGSVIWLRHRREAQL